MNASGSTSVKIAGTNANVIRPTEIATTTNVSSLNDRASIPPRNAAPRNSSASEPTASTESAPPPTRTVTTAASPTEARRYGSVFPATISAADTGATSSSSPRRLIRSRSTDEE